MNIHTDLIESKEFTASIEPSLLKHSQEFRVLATLRYLFPARFESMIIGEAPDLQDVERGIGIEVTAAVKGDDMRASRAFSVLRHGEPKKTEKQKERIEKSGYSIALIKDEKVAISLQGTSDGEKRVFQDSIRNKVKKLPQYRTSFTTVGLAILFPEIPTSYAETHLSEWISELIVDAENQFDFYYVISSRFCVYCDSQANIIEKPLLTLEDSCRLSTIGRMTAEGELTLSSAEWKSS